MPGTEVEGDDADVLARNVEAVDDAVGYVLLAHGVNHLDNNYLARCVVAQQFIDGLAFCQLSFGFLCAQGSQLGLVGLGVVVILATDKTLTVAYHPNLSTDAAEDDSRAGKPVFGMVGKPLEHGFLVVLADIGRYTRQKLLARGGLGHVADIAGSELHGIAAVGAQQAMPIVGLRSAAVNDGDEVICDDDSVLAFLLWVLGYEVLLDDFHSCCLCTRRNSRAELVSPVVCEPYKRVRVYRGRSLYRTSR